MTERAANCVTVETRKAGPLRADVEVATAGWGLRSDRRGLDCDPRAARGAARASFCPVSSRHESLPRVSVYSWGPPETEIRCKTCTRPTRQFARSNQCAARRRSQVWGARAPRGCIRAEDLYADGSW